MMDDPRLVRHGDAPALSNDPGLERQNDPPPVCTRGTSSIRSSCTSSERRQCSEAFSDLAEGTDDSPPARPSSFAAAARPIDPDLAKEKLSASQDKVNSTMDNPNFAALEKRKVQRLFESGAPFFSKTAMEDLQRQIEAAKKEASTDGQELNYFGFLSVTGLPVRRAIMNGHSEGMRLFGEPERRVEPCILYTSYQALLHSRYYSDQPPCALQICYKNQIEVQQPSPRSFVAAWDALALHRQRRKLQHSSGYTNMRATLFRLVRFPVDQIFAFACGSLSGSDNEQRRRSAAQHAFIVSLRQDLMGKFGKTIQCFAQDPAYTRADKNLLAVESITVVNDPQGFLGVTDNCAVVSFCPNVPVRQIITDLARPSVLVWDTVTDEDHTMLRWARGRRRQPPKADISGRQPPKAQVSAEELEACETDPPSSRVRDMIAKEYREIGKLDPDLFGESSVYVRDLVNGGGPFPRDTSTQIQSRTTGHFDSLPEISAGLEMFQRDSDSGFESSS
ncbi:hypothetical protein KVR01_007827 [Diaporthe batatas]|uniref:uncharacterized protein n=1 Tax=Diaporthe batatas TaxID=748121 RepID=UPI001D043245|nr:uncharacterized protein KVR01_007827 [Diaporthe batatas]KAG8162062.1 hypothetical protein KVR01_007827 [Diaporthe batatas]